VEPSVTEKPQPEAGTPRVEYAARLEACRLLRKKQQRLHAVLGNSRFGLFAASVVLAWVAFGMGWVAPAWLLVPAVLFVLLTVGHERANRAYRRAAQAVAFYEQGLARLDHRWAGAVPCLLRGRQPRQPDPRAGRIPRRFSSGPGAV
jgi:hypothetical protein